MVGGLGPPPALPGVGWPSTTGPVLAVTGGHPSSFLFFLFLSSSFFPPPLLSSSSHYFFTVVVAWPTEEGWLNPIECCLSADSGHNLGLGPDLPTGTPSGLNRYTGAGLAPMRRRAAQQPSLPLHRPLLPPEWPSREGHEATGPRYNHGMILSWLSWGASVPPPLSLSHNNWRGGDYLVAARRRRRQRAEMERDGETEEALKQ